jgi:hypothetical protein
MYYTRKDFGLNQGIEFDNTKVEFGLEELPSPTPLLA